jgi:hypothetical protein
MYKNDKKILLRSLISLLVAYLIVTVYIVLFPDYYNNVNNTRWVVMRKTLTKQIDISDTTINILFVGDSRPNAGIDFTQIEHSWSFCAGGSSPIENYFFIKKYLSVYSKPETIFVSISPRFLTHIFAFWDLAVKNDFYSFEEFNSIIKKYQNDTALGKFKKMRFLLYKMKFIAYYQEDLRNNLVFCGYSKNKILTEYILSHRGARPHPNLLDSCSSLNYETQMHNFIVPKIFDYYFQQIFKICADNNIKCIFFAMPMNRGSFEQLNNQMVKDYKLYLQSLAQKYPQAEISDSLYAYPDIFFGDESHLNRKGQKKFTDFFVEKYVKKVQIFR